TKGARSLRALGIETNGRRGQAPARWCLDWTERRPHVAGPVGTALAELALARGWVRRLRGTRALLVTSSGRTQLQRVFNLRYVEAIRRAEESACILVEDRAILEPVS